MQTRREQSPLFGWNSGTFLDVILSDGPDPDSFISDRFERPGGLSEVAVAFNTFPAFGGAFAGPGTLALIIEGSNDGVQDVNGDGDKDVNDHWTIISRSGINEVITAVSQGFLLNAVIDPVTLEISGEAAVDVQRYRWLRCRIEVLSGAPTYSCPVRVTGIAGDAQRFDEGPSTTSVTSASAAVVFTTPFLRPAGANYLNAQVVGVEVEPDGGAGWGIVLQGSFDGVNFNNLDLSDFVFTTTGEVEFFRRGAEQLIDMGPFIAFRWAIVTLGGNGPLSRATFSFYTTFDNNDVLRGDKAPRMLSESVRSSFIRVGFGAPVAGVVELSLSDYMGQPLQAQRLIKLILADSEAGFDLDLATTSTITVVGNGSLPGASGAALVQAATPANQAIIRTDTTGRATITVAGNPAFLSAAQGPPGVTDLTAPNDVVNAFTGQVVVRTDVVEVTP